MCFLFVYKFNCKYVLEVWCIYWNWRISFGVYFDLFWWFIIYRFVDGFILRLDLDIYVVVIFLDWILVF